MKNDKTTAHRPPTPRDSAAYPTRPHKSSRARRALWVGALGLAVAVGILTARANSHVVDAASLTAPTLVEFLDFECEACGALYPVVEELRQRYDGQINYVVRYFPIPSHVNSMNAALSVEAAAQQGQFEPMFDKLFTTQTEWGEQQVSKADLFRSYAESLGLDMTAYDAAIADPATKARIEQDYNDGLALGVDSTPTFFLDGKKLTLEKLTDLTDPLDQAIAKVTKR